MEGLLDYTFASLGVAAENGGVWASNRNDGACRKSRLFEKE